MKPGIYTASELSNEQYHAGPGISASGLKMIHEKTPEHYATRGLRPISTQQQATFDFGTHFHELVLEPDVFRATRFESPPGTKTTNKWKAAAAPFLESGMKPVKRWRDIHGMRDAVMKHVRAANLINTSIHEQAVYVEDPETGVLCKVRSDCFDGFFMADLKSAQSAKPEEFKRSAWKWGYHIQAAFYMDVIEWHFGTRPKYFYFIATEKEPPYATMVFKASPLFLKKGREDYRKALNLYAACLISGEWSCYSEETLTLDPPDWEMKDLEPLDKEQSK